MDKEPDGEEAQLKADIDRLQKCKRDLSLALRYAELIEDKVPATIFDNYICRLRATIKTLQEKLKLPQEDDS